MGNYDHDHHGPDDRTHHHHDEYRAEVEKDTLYIRTPPSALRHHEHDRKNGKPVFHDHDA